MGTSRILPRCIFCGRDAADRRDVCDGPRCRTLKARRLRDDRRRETERRDQVDVLMRRHEAELRAAGSPIPGTVLRARLPANEMTLAPLPDERRAEFVDSVRHSIDRAFDDPREPEPDLPKASDAQAALIGAACASCRGACCRFGATRAFLYPDHFRRYRLRHPEKTREEIAAEYRARLPEVTYLDSCVFHTRTGCALPREMRADVCNSWLCDGINKLLAAQPEGSPPLPVLSFCIRKERAELVRATLYDGTSTRVLSEGKDA